MKKYLFLSFLAFFAIIQIGNAQTDTVWTKNVRPFTTNKVKFSLDGQYIAVGTFNPPEDTGYVKVLYTQNGDSVWQHNTSMINDLAMSPDSNTFATAQGNKIINVWDLDSGYILHTFTKELFDTTDEGVLSSICYSNDGRYLYTILDYQITQLPGHYSILFKIDLETDSVVNTKELGYENIIRYSPTSDTIAITSNKENYTAILLMNTDSLEYINDKIPEQEQLTDMIFSPNGQYLATSSIDGTTKLWEMPDFNLSKTFSYKDESLWAGSIDISSDENYLVTGGSGNKNPITKVWDNNNGNILYNYNYGANTLSLKSDLNLLILGSGYKLYLLNFITDTTLVKDNNHPNEAMIIYPNPSSGKVNIELNIDNGIKYSIKIVNELGKEIRQINLDNYDESRHEISLDTSKLTNGIYFIIVRGMNYSTTYKLIKE